MNKKGFTTIELITSFSIASVIMLVLFNVIIIMKDNMSDINTKTNMLVAKDNLSYNINKRLKEKELASLSMCEDGDKCYLFTYSDSTTDKLVYNTDSITFNNYTFEITDGIEVEAPTITEHYDTMTSTTYNGYIIINIPITINNKDYSIKTVKYINSENVVVDLTPVVYVDNNGNKYTVVEYLESTGSQYIDTGITPNSNSTMLELKYKLLNVNGYNSAGLFGAGLDSKKASFDFVASGGGGDANKARFTMGKNWSYYSDFVADSNINTMIVDCKNSKFKVNENEYTVNASNWTATESLKFFVHGYSTHLFVGYVYYIRIYDNAVMVRDYIPVIDSSNRPCFFDKVERKCYYSETETDFLYG